MSTTTHVEKLINKYSSGTRSDVSVLRNISYDTIGFVLFNDQSFNNMLTKNIVSFEQLGPVLKYMFVMKMPCICWLLKCYDSW